MTPNEPVRNPRQNELALEKKHLRVLLDDDPTPKQRTAAEHRIEEIEVESEINGWLSSQGLQPPK
jgi:hypothetical protein